MSAPVGYAELHCLSNFTFLTGASHPEELVQRAHELGYAALAITDECSLAGVVRAHGEAKSRGLKLIIGSEFRLEEGIRLLLLAQNRAGYGNLSQLITNARRRAKKGAYCLTRADLDAGLADCLLLWLADSEADPDDGRWLADRFPDRAWLLVEQHRTGRDGECLEQRRALSAACGLPLAAAGGVLMHGRECRPLQDTLTAIRQGSTLAEAGFHLQQNGERHLRSLDDLTRFYPPELLAQTLAVADRCHFSLDELRYEYPDELVPEGETPAGWLRHLTEEGMRRRWPEGESAKVRALVEKELGLIAELDYEPYFLTVHDIVRFARSRRILCQGRGSAANSAVCYALGITEVDPSRMEMLFERFISKERDEPPDIDVDFEHQRREEVLQYVYEKYGRQRAALAATVISYRPKSAIRDVGKVLGLDLDQVDRLAKNISWWDGQKIPEERLREAGFDPANPVIRRTMALVRQIMSFPRHLSQHVGGMVISRGPLSRMVPIENAAMKDRTVIQWDKNDLEALGLLKVDCLALGMLSAIRRAFEMINGYYGWEKAEDEPGSLRDGAWGEGKKQVAHSASVTALNASQVDSRVNAVAARQCFSTGKAEAVCRVAGSETGQLGYNAGFRKLHPACERRFSAFRQEERGMTPAPFGPANPLGLHNVPAEDPAVYAMIQRAETVGVFQIESRAQMSMLPRLKPACFYDLVIEVAIVRPGPIQGDMVHPYLRRRQGLEPVTYPSEAVKEVLGRTLGVPIFQEQVIKVAMAAAGFTPGEADGLRRSIAAWRRRGTLEKFEARLVEGMVQRGYEEDFARRIYQQILGFGEYGFPESHAASFALLVYVSAWLKQHHPAAFFAAVINSLPMGFYGPAQLVREARRQAVEVRPPDVTVSDWDCALERPASGPAPALRLGLRLIKGLSRAGAERLTQERSQRAFADVDDMARRSTLEQRDLKALAAADALRALAGNRHQAVWRVAGIEKDLPLFRQHGPEQARQQVLPLLPVPTEGSDIVADYGSIGLSLRRHPLALLRERLTRLGLVSSEQVQTWEPGRWVRTAGIVINRQRPGSANSVTFVTLEDESGHINLVVWKQLAERQRKTLLNARFLGVVGEVQREAGVVHVIAKRLVDYSALLGRLATRSRDFR